MASATLITAPAPARKVCNHKLRRRYNSTCCGVYACAHHDVLYALSGWMGSDCSERSPLLTSPTLSAIKGRFEERISADQLGGRGGMVVAMKYEY